MKILWLSNKALASEDYGTSGTWLDAMAFGLIQSGKVALGNIATSVASKVARLDCGPIRQWIVPYETKIGRDGLPAARTVDDIIRCVAEFSPDLVHVWGTESFWGLLSARKLIRRPTLLEMQGLKYAIAKVYHGGLSHREQLSCTGLKEIVRQSTIWQGRKRFGKWALFEKEIISQHQYIAVQTKWIEAQVKTVNHGCSVFKTALLLRGPFYKAMPWKFSGNHLVFCSTAYASPFKGLHVAIEATAILRNKFPDIKLRISGPHQRKGLRKDGYVAWLNRKIIKLGLKQNIEWLGVLDATTTVAEMQMASAVLIPSYIENCSNAMQEAMVSGTPVVASYVGGLPSLADDEESALFFSPGDEIMCAYQLNRLLTEPKLAEHLSSTGKHIGTERNDPERVVSRQLEIYRQIISAFNGSGA